MDDFLKIKGYDETYEVSSVGVVKRVDCVIKRKNNTFVFVPGKQIKQKSTKFGYVYVGLSKNNKRKYFYVHRLVAEAFIPNPENKPCVNHKNGIKTDNRFENLEWCTRSENSKHAFDTGLNWAYCGEESRLSKLTQKEVLEIRKNYIPFICSYSMLAKKYNVSSHTIKSIIKRKSWKHI